MEWEWEWTKRSAGVGLWAVDCKLWDIVTAELDEMDIWFFFIWGSRSLRVEEEVQKYSG